MQRRKKCLEVKRPSSKAKAADSVKIKEEERFGIEELHDQPDVNLFDAD